MREYITEDQIAQMRLSTPIKFGPIGEDVFYRTYSRTLKNGNQEDWYDTCARVINGNLNFVDGAFIEKGEAEKLYKLFLGMEAMPAGRHLWATGIQHDKQFLNNCHAASFTDRFSEHFEHTFMRLMEGGGVGANYSKLFINSNQGKAWVPKTKVNLHLICNPNHADFNLDVEFVAGKKLLFKELLSNQYDWSWQGDTNPKAVYLKVEDSREGWCSSLISLLEYSISDEEEIDLIVDVSNVRPYGALLRGFGGKSSGPGALMVMLMKTTDLLNSKLNEKLGSLDHMWIDHYIAEAVVAGGARRSARLSLIHWKDSEIFDFIKCKQGSIAHWTSNISVVIDNKFFTALRRDDEHALEVYSQVCKGMLNNGEPGFINASQHLLGEAPNVEYYGSNPCSEISFVEYPDLKCFEVCCLAHINLDRVENPDEAFRLISRFLVRATFAPVADPRQAASIARNRRIGVGFLGLHNWLVKRGLKFSDASKKGQVIEFFHRMYKIVDETVRIYCKELRIPECIKKTTCAPTGSIGQLTGSSTGCQPVFSKFYIRRVRYSNSDDMLEKLKEKGYEIVPDVYAMNTSVVKYICIDPIYDQAVQYFKDLNIEEKYAREEAIALVEDQSELSLEDFLEMQAMLQKDFVDNSISMTINVDPKRYKIEDLMGVLKHYLPRLKGTTIFPEFGMELMPYERITYDEFLKYKDSGYPVEMGQAEQLCLNGSCPIR